MSTNVVVIGGDPSQFYICGLYDPTLQGALYDVAESIQKMDKLCVGKSKESWRVS